MSGEAVRTEPREGDDVAGGDDVHAPEQAGTPARRPRLPWTVAAFAAVVAVAAVITAVVLVQDARGDQARIAEVEEAAGRFALELTTWDATDGMANTREALRAAGTDSFAADVDQLFGGTDDLATLDELGARSVGEVEDVLVQAVHGDTAEALAVIVQEVTTEVTDGTELSLRYARLGLQHQDGVWLVDSVELVVDLLQEAAERSDLSELPGFGDSATEQEPDGE